MKTIFRFLSLPVIALAFVAAGTVTGFAQDNPCADDKGQTALYNQFLEFQKSSEQEYAKVKDAQGRIDYKKLELTPLKSQIEAGEQFVAKYKTCTPALDPQLNYFNQSLDAWKKQYSRDSDRKVAGQLTERFDSAIKAKNWDEVYAAGNDYANKFPNDPGLINKLIPLAFIGRDESSSTAKNYKYNADAIKYSKLAISQLQAGAKAKQDGTYGAFQFACASKDDCLNQLNFGIGYMTYFGQANKQAALPYFYEITKSNNPARKISAYDVLGGYYLETIGAQGQEIAKMIESAKGITDPEQAKAKDAEIKAKIALYNGYVERAIDAFARAWKLSDDKDAAAKAYKDNVYKTLQDLYKRRFDKDAGINEYLTAVVAKPFTDPTTPVQPVSDPEPVKDAATSTGAAATAPAAAAAPATATPAATKPAANPTKPAANVKSTPAGKTAKAGGASAKTTAAAKSGRRAGTN